MLTDSTKEPQLRAPQHLMEFLKREEDVVAHAAQLFRSGSIRKVFEVDQSDRELTFWGIFWRIIFFPLEILGEFQGRRANPHKPLFRYANYGRNKLMVFDEWLVRCTYQGYDRARESEHFYYSGMLLKDLQSVRTRGSLLSVWGEGGNLGGSMHLPRGEGFAIATYLEKLRAEGRLHKDVRID